MSNGELMLRVVLDPENTPGGGWRWASVMAGEHTLFRECVNDNEVATAEQNVMMLFSGRLRELLEDWR